MFLFYLVAISALSGSVFTCPNKFKEIIQETLNGADESQFSVPDNELCRYSMILECSKELVRFTKINVDNLKLRNVFPLNITGRNGALSASNAGNAGNFIFAILMNPVTILDLTARPLSNKSVVVNGTVTFAVQGQDKDYTFNYGASLDRMTFDIRLECLIFQSGAYSAWARSSYFGWTTQVDECYKLDVKEEVCNRLKQILETRSINSFSPAVVRTVNNILGSIVENN